MDAAPPSLVESEAAPEPPMPKGGVHPEGRRSSSIDPPGEGAVTGAMTGRGPAGGAAPEDPEGPPFARGMAMVIAASVAVVVVVSLILRFWTRSDLWLDEALTVNVARLPVHQIPAFLRRDGAPPLYYVLLHFWLGWFGHSDLAARSLSGVIGVVTIPLAWLAGTRLAGPKAGWAAMLLVITSPFAIRYDTEARMYSLVVLLTVLGYLALDRSVRRPNPGCLVGLAVVTSLLLYTHYWSIYLIGTVMLWLAWHAWRSGREWKPGARASLIAMVFGCLSFLPWLPTFLYQSHHTGTPWASPANFAAMVNAVSSFAGGGTSQGRALALIFFALAGLGLFGVATNRTHIDLDIRTRPLGRPVAFVVAGTLAAAVAGGFITNSAFDARYASVVFIPLILLVSIGSITFRSRRVRAAILAVAVVAGLASAFPNVTTNRTQAGQVAAAIARYGQPGDIVGYCPDQLGPAVDRLLPDGRYRQTTFPRGSGPVFVNWVDYAVGTRAGSPVAFAQRLKTAAGSGRQIFVVWAGQYQTLGLKCEGIVQTLQLDPDLRVQELVVGSTSRFYQPMWLVRFTPTKP